MPYFPVLCNKDGNCDQPNNDNTTVDEVPLPADTSCEETNMDIPLDDHMNNELGCNDPSKGNEDAEVVLDMIEIEEEDVDLTESHSVTSLGSNTLKEGETPNIPDIQYSQEVLHNADRYTHPSLTDESFSNELLMLPLQATLSPTPSSKAPGHHPVSPKQSSPVHLTEAATPNQTSMPV